MKLTVIKKAADRSLGTKVLRISIGGIPGDEKAYIVYRGNLDEIKTLLAKVLYHFSDVQEEPHITPDNGKHYA